MEFSQKTSLVNAEEPDASGRLVWKILIKWQTKRDITKKDQNKTKSTRTNDTSQSLRSIARFLDLVLGNTIKSLAIAGPFQVFLVPSSKCYRGRSKDVEMTTLSPPLREEATTDYTCDPPPPKPTKENYSPSMHLCFVI